MPEYCYPKISQLPGRRATLEAQLFRPALLEADVVTEPKVFIGLPKQSTPLATQTHLKRRSARRICQLVFRGLGIRTDISLRDRLNLNL